MRAIIIDPETQNVNEIEHNGDYKEIYALIGNECNTFEVPITLPNGDSFYCDEEALYHDNIGGVIYPNWAYPLVGRIVVVNTNFTNGDTEAAKSSIEDIKRGLTFIKQDDSKMVKRFAQFR